MAIDSVCADCGAELPSGAVGGMCSRCLLAMGLEMETDPAPTGSLDESDGFDDLSGFAPGAAIRYFGDYELIEEIGRGGMGVVFKARQVSLNRTVAIKMIVAGHLASPSQIQRFHTEAEAAARLDHPNIVPIYEIGEQDGRHYFAMRFVEEGTLSDRITEFQLAIGDSTRKGAREPKSSFHWTKSELAARKSKMGRLMIQVAKAVHYAHQRGIIHRDIKPGNILLDARGEPFVTDFGLAKALGADSDLTRTAAILGSPGYMSPEQAAGRIQDLSTASDIFSLGAILYELLTGRPPFHRATAIETLRAVVETEAKRPRLANPAIDPDIETICLKCLEKDPARRYASADALANDLEHWIHHEPIRARPASAWEHTRKWLLRRPPVFYAMTTAVVVSLIGGLAGILWQWDKAVEAREQAEANALRAEANARQAMEREAEARRFLYAANMNLAQQAWEQGNVARVLQLLEETAGYPEKGFEWYYWQRQTRLELKTLRGHRSAVVTVAFSPDGQRILTGSWDSTAKVWDAVSGSELLTLKGHSGPISSVAFSQDGRRILTGSFDSTAKVWDAVSGSELLTLKGHSRSISSLAFSPDGQRILTGGDNSTAKVWMAASPEQVAAWRAEEKAAAERLEALATEERE